MPLKYENRLCADRAKHADMLESLRRGGADIVYDGEDGLLLKDTGWELYMLSAADTRTGMRLLDSVSGASSSSGLGDVVVRDAALADYARALGYSHTQPMLQVLYEKFSAPVTAGTLDIRRPDEADFRAVNDTYHVVGEAQLRENFDSGDFFGAYKDGRFVGYMGVHPEGAMGMLHIFEEYRRRGYARELYSFMIDRQLRLGRLPYGQVFADNQPSMELQRALGFTFSKGPLFWMWK